LRILHVTIFGDNQATGAAGAYDYCWRGISDWANVIVVKPGRVSSLKGAGQRYQELSFAAPKLSDSSLFRNVARRLFRTRAPQIMADLDDFVRGTLLAFRLRGLISACDRVHSDSMWFTVIASMSPTTRRKLVHTELAGDWKFVADGSADFLTYLSYGCLARRVLNRVEVIAQSPVHAAYLVSCGVKRTGIRVVWHGRVDQAVFRPTKPKAVGGFEILYVGRIVPQKGVHILLRAVADLKSRILLKGFHVTIVGPVGEFGLSLTTSEYFEGLLRSAEGLGIAPNVDFRRFVALEELVDLYSAADVYVLPSLQDAFPFSVIEAMMCGTPVVGTDSGGMKEEILDGVVGFVLPPGDSRSLADTLELLYNDRSRRAAMGESARIYALKRFSLEGFPKEMYDAVSQSSNGP